MIIIGCDPGTSGAIAILDTTTGELNIHDVPSLQIKTKAAGNRKTKSGFRLKTELDISGLANLLRPYKFEAHAIIESVHSMPAQGVASVFSFGFAAGALRGVIETLQIPHTLVTPRAWKKLVLAGMGKEKDASIARAKQLFPKLASVFLKTKDGRAESALMAWYGKQTLEKGSSEEKPRRSRLVVQD